jgi:RimJ/RimL family protein N-acetyltransferase
MIVAKTKRLIISELKVEDAPFFLQLLNTPKWLEYIGDRNVSNVMDAKKYLIEKIIPAYTEQGFGFYKLALKKLNTDIGIAGLVKRTHLDFPDIGFALLPQYETKGYGYEASNAILELAKLKLNFKKVFGITLEHNKTSIKLLEKLGLEYEKRIKPFDDDEELLLFVKDLK